MTPRSHHIPKIADHIANYLHSPDLMFLQEISDDSGASDNGVVSANKTLAALVKAIAHAGGAEYEFVNIPPVNNMDGGKPGSNIRVAYLYVRLAQCSRMYADGIQMASAEVVPPSRIAHRERHGFYLCHQRFG